MDKTLRYCQDRVRQKIETFLSELDGVTREIKTVLSRDLAEDPIVGEWSETSKDRSGDTIGIPEGYEGRIELQLLYREILSIVRCLNKLTHIIQDQHQGVIKKKLGLLFAAGIMGCDIL